MRNYTPTPKKEKNSRIVHTTWFSCEQCFYNYNTNNEYWSTKNCNIMIVGKDRKCESTKANTQARECVCLGWEMRGN